MLGYAEGSTACAVLVALGEHEITLSEFIDAIEPLTSEALMVMASALRSVTGQSDETEERLSVARTLCSQFASAARVLS